MSEMVTLSNAGLIPLEAITTMGINAKEGENPIGFFGTGLKYAISTLASVRRAMRPHFPWPAALFLAAALIALVVVVASLGRRAEALPSPASSLTPLAGDHFGTGQVQT